ncbi:hypothetical protein GCM10007897_44100 [Sphingobium jiangsuense]|uniref:Glycosyltransferase n=1 Tax=Sphingobium jiangsuense TaxID=870476 RepID=A0A7W6FSI8_9SPHN|nr:hypothetical protein [Sphingobium jiangsuense]MBB3928797.1 hypothetical protein [Sphingobium jiangsuense]GLT02974.1 hypothetical protein GCM10007897_44100 [Sphingobium jiangsuense]
MSLTIATWYWKQPDGRTNYTVDHIAIWRDMVRRHLSMDHRLAVLTHEDISIEGVEVIRPPREFDDVRLPTWGEDRGLPQCLRRISMFAPDAGDWLGERFVSMDLDCVIAEPLDPLFDRKDDFIMYRGTTDKRPYNGSMLLMTAGARSKVYTEFTPERAIEAGKQYLGSDQAWISHVLGWGEATWGAEDGVVWWGSRRNHLAPSWRLMFFPGNPKPWDLAENGWIGMHYRPNDEWDEADMRFRKRKVA